MKIESFNFWLYLHQNLTKYIGSLETRNNLDQHMQQYLVERTVVLEKWFKSHFKSHFCYIWTFPNFQFSYLYTGNNRTDIVILLGVLQIIYENVQHGAKEQSKPSSVRSIVIILIHNIIKYIIKPNSLRDWQCVLLCKYDNSDFFITLYRKKPQTWETLL